MPPPISLQSISCLLGFIFPHQLLLDFAFKPDRHEDSYRKKAGYL